MREGEGEKGRKGDVEKREIGGNGIKGEWEKMKTRKGMVEEVEKLSS